VPSKRLPSQRTSSPIEGYDSIVSELINLVESARRVSARAVNSIMTATYWEIGRRIVESEQQGRRRAGYGEALLKNLAGGQGLAQLRERAGRFPLPWSHYVRLLAVSNGEARKFYGTEALRCGWSRDTVSDSGLPFV
jgi:DUF1016 N-terminal domain